IVFTEYVKRELAEWLGDDKNIYVIPHGVDDIFFHEDPTAKLESRDRWSIPHDAFVVLHVGSGIERKNLPTVFATVRGLRRDGLDAWLLQAGATLTKDQIKTANSLGLDEHSVFLGQVEEKVLRSAYKASDVFCFPSQYEGFGLPVLEAMASGLPVVSSGAGGLSEVQGDAGVIVRSNDSEPYRAELHRIASDSAHRTQKARQGVERAHQFTWSRAARSTADVYRKMLA
ncbi:MAG: glycosyltransferase family 1 protein, partial [Gemmatimonadales bacterium]